MTTNPKHLNCPTQFVWYAKSTWNVQLYVWTQANCNAWVVTTNPNHLNCSTASIWYLWDTCSALQSNTIPAPANPCSPWEAYINWQCVNPVLLMHFEWANWSTNYIDEYWHNFVNVWNAKISTAYSKFWWSSLYTNYNNWYIYLSNGDLTVWNQLFTLDFWYLQTVYPTNWYWYSLMSYWNWSDWTWWFALQPFAWNFSPYPKHVVLRNSYGNLINWWASPISNNEWHHIAITRETLWGNIKMYVDWVSAWFLPSSSDFWSVNYLKLWHYTCSWCTTWDLYIDELRFVKWQSLYSWNFTVPTSSYQTSQLATYPAWSWYFSWNAWPTVWYKKADGSSYQSCKDYNLNATTNVNWTSRWAWTCWDWTKACLTSWNYSIDPLSNWNPIVVYCDMSTDWGWWTWIIKKKVERSTWDPSVDSWTTSSSNYSIYSKLWSITHTEKAIYDNAWGLLKKFATWWIWFWNTTYWAYRWLYYRENSTNWSQWWGTWCWTNSWIWWQTWWDASWCYYNSLNYYWTSNVWESNPRSWTNAVALPAWKDSLIFMVR